MTKKRETLDARLRRNAARKVRGGRPPVLDDGAIPAAQFQIRILSLIRNMTIGYMNLEQRLIDVEAATIDLRPRARGRKHARR